MDWWHQCFGMPRNGGSGKEHPVERAARRDLMAHKRELRSASLKIARERAIAVKTARAAHKRGEDIRVLAEAIMQADKQLERNTAMTAKLELCLGRLRRVRIQRQMVRSVETAAHVMRFVNTTLRSDTDLAQLATQMEREMLRYTDLQDEVDAATDMVLAESPLAAQRGDEAADAEEQDEADTEADKVLKEVLATSKSPLVPTAAVQNDNARLQLIMAQIKRLPDVEVGGNGSSSHHGDKKNNKSAVARALGMRNGGGSSDSRYGHMSERSDTTPSTDIEMQDMARMVSSPSTSSTTTAAAAAAAALSAS